MYNIQIPLVHVRYLKINANSTLHASLAIYHLALVLSIARDDLHFRTFQSFRNCCGRSFPAVATVTAFAIYLLIHSCNINLKDLISLKIPCVSLSEQPFKVSSQSNKYTINCHKKTTFLIKEILNMSLLTKV